jgi:hypothetical protein
MRNRSILAVVTAALVSGTAIVAAAHAHTASAPTAVNPSNFVRHVTNPWYPLKPGTVLVYKGVKDGERQTDRVTVTRQTKRIEGVRTTVIRDVSTHGGTLLESTWDFYAQDKQGNVWYFGENTRAYHNGHVSTEGSWQAGVNGARPGIIMEGTPRVSSGYRQEYYRNHAEDQAWVVGIGATLHVPYGRVHPILRSFEWTRLEPSVIDEKDYGRGIGIVREVSRTGALETAYLVHVHRP